MFTCSKKRFFLTSRDKTIYFVSKVWTLPGSHVQGRFPNMKNGPDVGPLLQGLMARRAPTSWSKEPAEKGLDFASAFCGRKLLHNWR